MRKLKINLKPKKSKNNRNKKQQLPITIATVATVKQQRKGIALARRNNDKNNWIISARLNIYVCTYACGYTSGSIGKGSVGNYSKHYIIINHITC